MNNFSLIPYCLVAENDVKQKNASPENLRNVVAE